MATPYAIKLGKDAVLLINQAVPPATDDLEAICNVGDLELALEKEEEDVSVRCAGGWSWVVYTMKNATLTFTMNHDTGDQYWRQLHDAWLNDTPVELIVLDGPATPGSGSEGLRATFAIGKFTASQPIKGAQRDAIEAKPTPGIQPTWYTQPTVVGATGPDVLAGEDEPAAEGRRRREPVGAGQRE